MLAGAFGALTTRCGPKDINARILHSGPCRPRTRKIPAIMVCRIFLFMWYFLLRKNQRPLERKSGKAECLLIVRDTPGDL